MQPAPGDLASERPARSAWFLAALCVLVWVSRMALPGDLLYTDLDRSWGMGIAYALEHGWRFGVDTVFTFGPLGCLSTGLYLENFFWIKVLAWEGAFQLLVAVVVTMAGASIETRLNRVLYFVLIVAAPLEPDAYAFLAIVAALAWIARSRDPRAATATGATVLAGLALVKFTYSVAALVCVLASTAILWRSAPRRQAAAFFLGFLALTALAWKLCGQSLADLPTYVARSMQLSSGYSEAMSSPAPPWAKGVAIALLAAAALGVTLARPRFLFAAAWAAVLWIAYKAGFVRAHDHTPIFFACAAVAPLLLGARALPGTAACLACAALGVLGLCIPRSGWFVEPGTRIAAHAAAALHPRAFRAGVEARDRAGQEWMDLPRTRQIVGARPIDVVSYFQVLLLRNELQWRPRPVFQSYAAFSPELQDLNARFFEGASAPEYVLFYLHAIDERISTTDDAAAIQILARDYAPILREKDLLLLHREPRPAVAGARETWMHRTIGFDERIDLRGLPGKAHVLSLDIRPTLAGRLRTFLDSGPPLFVEFELDDGDRVGGRIVPSMARSGFIVDPMLRTQQDWTGWCSGKPVRRPIAVRVVAPESPWMFEPTIDLRIDRADDVVPRTDPELGFKLTYSLFPTAPVDATTAQPASRRLLYGEEVVVLSATSSLGFDVAPGSHRLSGKFALPSARRAGGAADGAVFRAVLTAPGKADRILFEERLDPPRGPADRRLRPFEVGFETDVRSRLVLRSEAGPKADPARDTVCWTGIEIATTRAVR